MSGYLRKVVYEGDFDGDTVKVVMNPVKIEDVLAMRDINSTSNELDMAERLNKLFRTYAVEVSGLRAADGSDVTLEEVASHSYFSRVVVQAGMRLLESASPRSPKA